MLKRDKETMKIDEIFMSLQGEAQFTGIPTTFIRFYGCNLNCPYCDQPQNFLNAKDMTVGEVMDIVKKYDLKHVCVTGGEPTIHSCCHVLIAHLLKDGFIVDLETNGSMPIDATEYEVGVLFSLRKSISNYGEEFFDIKNLGNSPNLHVIMDYKTDDIDPLPTKDHNLNKHLGSNDEVKCVIGSPEDYDFYLEVVNSYFRLHDKGHYNGHVNFIFSPMFEFAPDGTERIKYDFIDRFIIDKPRNTRVGLQVHKLLKCK